jgi:hypothetical protein
MMQKQLLATPYLNGHKDLYGCTSREQTNGSHAPWNFLKMPFEYFKIRKKIIDVDNDDI